MTEEEFKTVTKMETYGGSFVKALAKAFYCADKNNFEKLKKAFSEYWEEYRKL